MAQFSVEIRHPAGSVLAEKQQLWQTKRLDTVDIAGILGIHEAEVERIIHAGREARRKAAVAA